MAQTSKYHLIIGVGERRSASPDSKMRMRGFGGTRAFEGGASSKCRPPGVSDEGGPGLLHRQGMEMRQIEVVIKVR